MSWRIRNPQVRSGRASKSLVTMFALLVIVAVVIWRVSSPPSLVTTESLHRDALAAFARQDVPAMRSLIHRLRMTPGAELRVDQLQGMLDVRLGNLTDAVRKLSSAGRDNTLRPATLPLLGEALSTLGRHMQAIQILEEHLKSNPGDIASERWLASSYYDIGATEFALEHMATVAKLDSKDPRPHRLRGLVHKDFERYEEAIPEYQESLRRSRRQPDVPQILKELAECQIKTHQYAEAVQTLVDAEPTADVLALRAECAMALNEPERAASLLTEAIRRDATHANSLLLSARMAEELNDDVRAEELLRKAAATHPTAYDVRYQLAIVLGRLGKKDEAEKELLEVTRIQKLRDEFTKLHTDAFLDLSNADLRVRIGELAEELQKPELAQTWYEAALAIDPRHEKAIAKWKALTIRESPDHANSSPGLSRRK